MNNNSSYRDSVRCILEDIKCSTKCSCNCKLFVSAQIKDSGVDRGISTRIWIDAVNVSGFGVDYGVGGD